VRRRRAPSPDDTDGRAAVCRCSQDLVPFGEVAARLDVSDRTLARWARLYGMPVVRIGGAHGSVFCLWSAVERWALARM
jgi:hypothetical protein